MISVVTVTITLVQINIIDAGTGIEHGIIKDKTFDMEYTKDFAALDWYAINLDGMSIFATQPTIKIPVGLTRSFTNTTTLGTMKIDEDTYIECGVGLFRLKKCPQDLFTRSIGFQIKCRNIDAARGAAYQLQ